MPVRIIFVRSGIVVEGTRASLELFKGAEKVAVKSTALDHDRQLLEFAWNQGATYHLESKEQEIERREVLAPMASTPYFIRALDLDVKRAESSASAITDTAIRISPNGNRVAVGTLFGSLHMINIWTGQRLWNLNIPEGMIKRLEFSQDGNLLYVGEQSPDAWIYALDAGSGKQRWKFRLSDDLERSKPPAADDRYGIYWLPGVFRIRALPSGEVLVAGTHSWSEEGVQKNRSRVYILSANGEVTWRYPESDTIDANITWVDTDARGTVAVFSTSRTAEAPPKGIFRGGGIYFLDLELRVLRWMHVFQPLKPEFSDVFLWQAVAVSPDGGRVIAGLGDGRVALFDAAGSGEIVTPLRTLPVGTPINVGGIPVASPVSYAHSSATLFFAQTNDTNIPSGTEASARTAPAPHPAARTLFALDRNGDAMWQFRSTFTPAGIWSSQDGKWVMMTTANPYNDPNTDQHGVVLLNSQANSNLDRMAWNWPTVGPVFFDADLSRDGRVLAFAETPALKPDRRTLYGRYQLHLVH